MNKKKFLLPTFILIALTQLYIPAKMIADKEKVLNTGIEYKFKTAPIDPSDPFRGKYITLNYDENQVEIQNEKDWNIDEPIYVCFTEDKDGFAKIEFISKEKPKDNQDFLKAKVNFVTSNGANKLTIDYSFNRFYMEESKASDAERIYRKSLQDSSQITYALVYIKSGEAVLKDVLVDGISIKEIVKKENQK